MNFIYSVIFLKNISSWQVFLSSVTYLDTVLAQMSLPPSQLQLLASACLSLASKLSDPRPLSLYKLVVATDCSCSLAELQAMEMVVLQKLQWELSSPSPLHFLSLLLAQLDTRLSAALLRLVEKQAETFLMLAATEYKFYSVRPSIMVSTGSTLQTPSLSCHVSRPVPPSWPRWSSWWARVLQTSSLSCQRLSECTRWVEAGPR